MGKEDEYIIGEPQQYKVGNILFTVEPRYRKDGQTMGEILLRLMMADVEKEMWNRIHSENEE